VFHVTKAQGRKEAGQLTAQRPTLKTGHSIIGNLATLSAYAVNG
jgi:hypothetical protein